MAKGFKHGGIGSQLNFRVIPWLSQPESALENTILVKTDKINNWYFSATQPEEMQEWDVWFQTGTKSFLEFNALKENVLQTYPLSAKQYLNGKLEEKPMSVWQNGKWNDSNIYIVKSGVITDIGLSGIARPAEITITEEDGYLTIKETDGKSSGVTTPEKVNVDNISRIHATIDLKSSGTTSSTTKLNGVSVALFSDLDNSSVSDLASAVKYQAKTTTLGKQDLDLDLSAVSGSYYIGFAFASSSSSGMPDFDVYDFFMVQGG